MVNLGGSSYTQSQLESQEINLGGSDQDPRYANTGDKDLHLQSSSPAIDTGIALASPYNVDKDGIARPQGLAFDIGAYEYTSGTDTTITLTPIPTSGEQIPGDANGDGNVDIADYVIWFNNYKKSLSGGSVVGDFNGSGTVDGVDYIIWLTNITAQGCYFCTF